MDRFDEIARRAADAVHAEAARVAGTEDALADLKASGGVALTPVPAAAAARRRLVWIIPSAAVVAAAAIVAVAVGLHEDGNKNVITGDGSSTTTVTTTASATTVLTGPTTPVAASTSVATSGLPATTVAVPTTVITAAPTTVKPTGTTLALPKNLSVVDASYVNAATAYVLGHAETAEGALVLVHREPGVTGWRRVAVPVQTVQHVVFADNANGWVYGDAGLWATHTSGRTWKKVALASVPGAVPDTIAAAGGKAVLSVFDPNNPVHRILTAPVASDTFTLTAVKLTQAAGPVNEFSISLSGSTGYLIYNDRIVAGGARLVNGAWQSWTPPCADKGGPAQVAATTGTVAVLCSQGVWTGDQPTVHVYLSTDGGSTFTETAALTQDTTATGWSVAWRTPTQLVVAYQYGSQQTSPMVVTTDGGKTVAKLYTAPAGSILSDVAFTSATDGTMIVSGSGHLSVTTNGGTTWTTVSFGH